MLAGRVSAFLGLAASAALLRIVSFRSEIKSAILSLRSFFSTVVAFLRESTSLFNFDLRDVKDIVEGASLIAFL